MKSKDARMKVTTEAINNIKMIKLYSWQENFLERIYRCRERDISALRVRGLATALLVFFIYLLPSMLPVTTFATFIGLGNYLKYEIGVAALVLFNIIRGPLIQAPIFFGDLIQLSVSMKRIDKFLRSDEVQKEIKDQKDADGSDKICLSIQGSFSWGFTQKAKNKDKNGNKQQLELETKQDTF